MLEVIEPFMTYDGLCKFGVVGYFDDDLIVEGVFCIDCKHKEFCSIYKNAINRMKTKPACTKPRSKIYEYLHRLGKK